MSVLISTLSISLFPSSWLPLLSVNDDPLRLEESVVPRTGIGKLKLAGKLPPRKRNDTPPPFWPSATGDCRLVVLELSPDGPNDAEPVVVSRSSSVSVSPATWLRDLTAASCAVVS